MKWEAARKDVGVSVAGEVIYLVLGYAITFLIAREAGPRALGIYALSLTLVNVGEIGCTLGLRQANLRYIPVYLQSSQTALLIGLVRFAGWTSALLGIGAGIALIALSPIMTRHLFQEPVLRNAFPLIGLALPLLAVRAIWSYALQGFKATGRRVLVEKVLSPGTRLVAIGLFFLLGMKLLGGVLAILVGAVISAGFALLYVRKIMASIPTVGPVRYEARSWLSYSTPLLFQSLALFVQPNVPILLIGHLMGSSQVGLFSAALKMASLVSLPLVAVNVVLAPQLSELHAGGELERLGALYKTMTGWTVALGLIPFSINLFLATPIMRVFGPMFEVTTDVLQLLTVGHLLGTMGGAAGCILTMTGRVKVSLANALVGSGLSVLLNLLLIPPLGIRGAALASAIALTGVSILGLTEVFYFFRFQPFSLAFLKGLIWRKAGTDASS